MANEKKMTKREMFTEILAIPDVANDPDLSAFVEHEIELLNKKKSSVKMTAQQIANKEYAAIVMEILSDGSRKTVTELIKSDPRLGGLSSQRVTAVLTTMVGDTVQREKEKGKSLYSLA